MCAASRRLPLSNPILAFPKTRDLFFCGECPRLRPVRGKGGKARAPDSGAGTVASAGAGGDVLGCGANDGGALGDRIEDTRFCRARAGNHDGLGIP